MLGPLRNTGPSLPGSGHPEVKISVKLREQKLCLDRSLDIACLTAYMFPLHLNTHRRMVLVKDERSQEVV